MALYRKLRRRQTQSNRNGSAASSRHLAAQVAVEMDLKPQDTVRLAMPVGNGRAPARPLPVTHDFLDALGIALRNHTRRNGKVVVVWAAQADPEALRDALESARAHKLPIIFVTEASNPARRNGSARLLNGKVAPGEEMPHITVDGNDVVAAYRVAHEAIERARRDRGPTLIECASFRVQGRRNGNHLDPVANLESYMRAKKLPIRVAARESAAPLRRIA